MAGVELRIRITGFKSLRQCFYFFLALLTIEQVETTYNGMNGVGTSRQNILQSAMGTACEEQPIGVQNQFMTEIIAYQLPVSILHIEVLISLGHRMNLRNMSYGIDAF